MFVDPVFSAGVLVATTEGKMVAEIAAPLLKAGVPIGPEHFDDYTKTVERGYGILNRYIYNWPDPVFRRFFLSPPNRGRTVKTVITILAGGVFDPKLIGNGDAPLFLIYRLYRLWLKATAPFRRLIRRPAPTSP